MKAHQKNLSCYRIWIILVILIAALLRGIALDKVPPGFAPDETTNGYDAYSILRTGRDQHGVFLPLVMRSLNDYRMPLFIYLIIPFIKVLGLNVYAVRMASAIWGIALVPVVYWLGTRMWNPRAGLIAALFLALSPWHVPFSRMGLESSLVTFLLTLGIACLWEWKTTLKSYWLYLAGLAFGLSIYTYSTAKLLIPLTLLILGIAGHKKWRQHQKDALLTVGLILLLALPMALLTLKYTGAMQARYDQIAVIRPDRSLLESASMALQIFLRHFSPNYLFLHGDLDILQHPPYGGQLYWIQAPLLLGGLGLLASKEHRETLLFIIGWLILATIPTALTQPNLPGSAHALRHLIAAPPFQLLTAFAAGELWELKKIKPQLTTVLLSILTLGLSVNATYFFYNYFTAYPAQVAHRFDDGMQTVIEHVADLDTDYETVIFSEYVSWPYISIAFFTQYPPEEMHANPPVRGDELFAPVTEMGKYRVVPDIERTYHNTEHGLFIGPFNMLPEVPPLALIYRPASGEPCWKIVGK